MPTGETRNKVLFGLGAARGAWHRYTIARWIVGIVFTALIAALPLAGILRFDLWSGHHVLLGEHVSFVEAAKAFAFPFLAVNVAIILTSRFFGRYLCGFVCPYGALARLAEWLDWRERKWTTRFLRIGVLGSISLLLASIVFSFWVDWRVFAEGSRTAALVAGVFLFGMASVVFGSVSLVGLRFCRNWCPSGVYFALLGPKTANGIEFAHPETCTDCKACEAVCPVDLSPREMELEVESSGYGLYPDGMSGHALCIRCGDCVTACEGTTSRLEVPTPLRMGMLSGAGGSESEEDPSRDRAAG